MERLFFRILLNIEWNVTADVDINIEWNVSSLDVDIDIDMEWNVSSLDVSDALQEWFVE